ncbi:hypothetical protein [Macrococcus animalis]|uniref:hypothetical protein n=1 Tax=Macrococcus animalis TaxID=3395467 RepID=UPI0039BE18A8
MKKLLLSSIFITCLVGQVNVADAKGQVKPCYTASKVQVKAPNMLNSKTINAIKTGQYSFNGVKLDMYYPTVKKILGEPKMEMVAQNQFGKTMTLKYDDISFALFSNDRYAKSEKLKVIDVTYTFPKKNRLDLKQLQGKYGKPEDVTTGAKEKDVNYNNFLFQYTKSGKSWLLNSMDLLTKKEPVITEKTMAKNNRKTKIAHHGQYTITNSDIKHMAKGTFALKGAKLNMTAPVATKAIGQALESRKVITPYGTTVSQDYAFGEVHLSYYAKDCTSAPVLKQMIFNYEMRGLNFSKIESLVGKPDKVVNGKLDTTYVGNKEIKVKTRTNTYGHLIAKGSMLKVNGE